MRPWFFFIFAIILSASIVTATEPQLLQYHAWCKPLIMLSLLVCVIIDRNKAGYSPWLLSLAVLFSLLGDLLLLPAFDSAYFVLGLLSFLLAHIVYIILFLNTPSRLIEVPFVRRNPWMIFLFIVYGIWMFTKIKGGAGEIAWAVALYILVILTMLVVAFNRQGSVSKRSFYLVAIGALLFVISDSILSWNRFVEPIAMSPLLILGTYGLAQLLIVRGVIAQGEEDL